MQQLVKNTHTILLDRVWISLRQSEAVALAANTKNISHLAIICFGDHPCRLHHAIAVILFVGKRGPGSNWAVVRLDALHPKII